jgi:hypothetical protein
MLTCQQIRHFHTFGFLVLRDVLTPQEVEKIDREFEVGLAEADHAPRGAGERRQLTWSNLRPDMPFATGLLEDARCVRVAEQLFGPDVVGCDSGASHFAGGQSPWHPDTQDMHLFGFKLAFYLQPLDANSGALRFLPGSHKVPYYDDLFEVLWPNGDATGCNVNVPDYPAFVCQTHSGDAVAFNFHVWHASWGGSTDRRMVSLQYQKNPTTPHEQASIHKHVKANEQVMKEFGRDGPFHHPYWVSNPGGSRLRERWIGKLREWGYIRA